MFPDDTATQTDNSMIGALRVLFAEDEAYDAELIERALRKGGMKIEAKRVETEEDFIRAIKHFSPHIILSDYSMPKFDGIRALALAGEFAPEIPVIIMTGPRNEETAVACMKAGAVDYILKDRLGRLVSAVSVALEHNREHQTRLSLEGDLQKMASELEIARQIQTRLLPNPIPRFEGYDIGGVCYASEVAGGDFFDVFPMVDGTLGLAICDVLGHGLGSALHAVATYICFRTLSGSQADLSEMFTAANGVLGHQCTDHYFVCLAMVKLDCAKRRLVYASAAQESGYIFDRAGKVKVELESLDIPLAVEEGTEYTRSQPFLLDPGDTVCLLTDGIREATNPEDVQFGTQRTLEVVRNNLDKSAQDIAEALHTEVCVYRRRPILDDVTALVVKVDPNLPANSAPLECATLDGISD